MKSVEPVKPIKVQKPKPISDSHIFFAKCAEITAALHKLHVEGKFAMYADMEEEPHEKAENEYIDNIQAMANIQVNVDSNERAKWTKYVLVPTIDRLDYFIKNGKWLLSPSSKTTFTLADLKGWSSLPSWFNKFARGYINPVKRKIRHGFALALSKDMLDEAETRMAEMYMDPYIKKLGLTPKNLCKWVDSLTRLEIARYYSHLENCWYVC